MIRSIWRSSNICKATLPIGLSLAGLPAFSQTELANSGTLEYSSAFRGQAAGFNDLLIKAEDNGDLKRARDYANQNNTTQAKAALLAAVDEALGGFKHKLSVLASLTQNQRDWLAVGEMTRRVGSLVNDPDLQLQGAEMMLSANYLSADETGRVQFFSGALAYSMGRYEAALKHLKSASASGYIDKDAMLPRLIADSEYRIVWGDLAKMLGKKYIGDYDSTRSILHIRNIKVDNWDGIRLFRQEYSDIDAGWYVDIFNDLSKNQLRLQNYNGMNYKVVMGNDGSFGYFGHRYRILPDGNLEVTRGNWDSVSRSFTALKAPVIWRRYSIAENSRRLAQLQDEKASGGGDSGLFGALAMGIGAAMAGGNSEMVMGAAMKGMELATDNDMSRSVLAGQGQAMIEDGAEAMKRETTVRNSGAMPVRSEPASQLRSDGQVAAGGTPPGDRIIGSRTSLPLRAVPTYFFSGMTPTAQNTRNPNCYSTTFNVDVPWDDVRLDNGERHLAAANRWRELFLQKCSRFGEVSQSVHVLGEGVTSGFPRSEPHPEDVVVEIP